MGAAPDETVKSPVIDVLVYDARSGVGDAGFELPKRAVVAPGKRGHEGAAGADAAVVHQLDLAGVDGGAGRGKRALGAAGERRTPVARGDAVDDYILGAGGEVFAEVSIGKTKGEAVTGRKTPVHRGREGIAGRVFAGVAPRVVGEIGFIGRSVGQSRARGSRGVRDRGGATPLGRLVALRRILHRVAGGKREPEVSIHRHDRRYIEAGMNLVSFFTPTRTGRLAQKGALGVLHQEGDAVVVGWAAPLERAARHEIHRAGEGGAGLLGRG